MTVVTFCMLAAFLQTEGILTKVNRQVPFVVKD